MKCRVVLAMLFVIFGYALSGDYGISLSLKGTMTSNTRMMYDVNVSSYTQADRNVSSSFGYGADVRSNLFFDRFFLGFSVEIVRGSTTVSQIYPLLQNLRVPMEEGFEARMAELSGYYIVPISSETILFYLGGGVGYYTGKRVYSVAGYHTTNLRSTSNIGIHVLTGTEFRIFPNVALRTELKFRDPYFDATTRFDKSFVIVEGQRVALSQQERVTRINLYGINYVAGLVFSI